MKFCPRQLFPTMPGGHVSGEVNDNMKGVYKGKRAEIGRITSKHAKVSQEVAEETFDDTNLSKPQIPEVDKATSEMNGPVSDDQDDVDSKEELMDTSIADPGGKDETKTEMELEEDSARPEGVVRFVVKDFSRLRETILSDPVYIRNLPWRLMCIQRTTSIHTHENKTKTLAVFLQCNPETESLSWSCNATAQLVLVNQKFPEKSFKKKIQHLFFAKENDWGFNNFKEWSEILNTENGFLVDDTIIVEAHVVAEAPHGVAWDSKKHTGYVGLKNQGATCYMNSLLQTLFFTNKLRTAVYHMPTAHDDPQRSVAFNLQRVFYELQFSDKAVGTKKLTRSFGWETLDSFMQHDVQELCRVLLDNMESKMKGTCVEGVIPKLLEGKMCSYIKCTNVDYVSDRTESFYDIQLNVKGKKDIYESFKEYIAVETLDGDNKYDAGDHGMQEAKKGVIFHTLPTVLHLQLMRFQYDPMTDANVKINDRYEFFEKIDLSNFLEESRQTQATYTLHAVLVHSGDNHGGHYVVYINPKGDGKWCKFDDDVVSLASKQEAVDHNFGGYDDDISVKYCTNAYMLVYIKDSCLDDVLDTSAAEIPKELEEKLKEEKRLEAQRRKERSEAHLYMTVEVITEDQFCGHQGYDLFDSKKHSSKMFKILKEDTVGKMMVQLANALGYKPNQVRPWPFQSRKNNTYRVGVLDTDSGLTKITKVIEAVDNENECTLFIETTDPCDPNATLPAFDMKTDILLFFKYYDPRSETMSYCGHAYVSMASKISTLLPMLCERAHLPKETPLMLFEEVRPGLTEHFKDLNVKFEDLADIMDGDIFCFQRKDIDLDEYKLRTCIDYFRDYHHRIDVAMCDKNIPNDPGFNVILSSRMTYTQMAEKVAWYLDVDPRKIQFFKAQLYGGGLPGNPIRCTYEGTLRDLMMYGQKSPRKLFYQLLSIPIDELENKRQIKCVWISKDLKEQKELVLYPDKNGKVQDLLNEAKKHVVLAAEGSGKLRLLMVLSSKVQDVLHEESELDMFTTGFASSRTYRVEEVPTDEVNVEEDEELIPVAHFQKDTFQTFGTPFLLKIRDKEKVSTIIDRIKQKLDMPEKDFEKIKFALVRSGRQMYLQDERDKPISIQDFRPSSSNIKLPNNSLSRPWLGLDHVDKAPKKSRYSYLERSIKILN